jgi:isoleucyl-tRNA synthetase
VVEDLSHWYVRVVRRRFWLEKKSPDKIAAYTVLAHALNSWLCLAAPMIPFLTETIYRESFRNRAPESADSIHMKTWPRPNQRWINSRLEEEMKIAQHISEAAASARQSKKIKLRQPVSEIIVVSDRSIVRKTVRALRGLLLQQTNAKRIRKASISEVEQLKRLIVEPNYKSLGPAFRAEANRVAQELRKHDGRLLLRAFKEVGHFLLKVDGKDYRVVSEMITLKEEMPDNYAVGSFEEGRVYVDLTIPDDLVREGFVRDVIRRLQEMRKRLDLPVDAFVEVFIALTDPEKLSWLEDEKDTLLEEVRARTVMILRKDEATPKATLIEDWQLQIDHLQMGMSQEQKEQLTVRA